MTMFLLTSSSALHGPYSIFFPWVGLSAAVSLGWRQHPFSCSTLWNKRKGRHLDVPLFISKERLAELPVHAPKVIDGSSTEPMCDGELLSAVSTALGQSLSTDFPSSECCCYQNSQPPVAKVISQPGDKESAVLTSTAVELEAIVTEAVPLLPLMCEGTVEKNRDALSHPHSLAMGWDPPCLRLGKSTFCSFKGP